MSIYFDFKTINELTGDNYYRQQREFTLEELSQYTGRNGRPAYAAIEGVVYDISNFTEWGGGTRFGVVAGQDLTSQFDSSHGIIDILANAPRVGILIDDGYMNDMNYTNFQSTMPMNRQTSQDKSKFTPDDWIRYIAPLVVYALREPSLGMNSQRLYQKVILLGVLVGLGKTPQEAINQVQEWQNTGASQLLKSGTGTTGGTGTSGGMGTGGGTGTSGGFGTGTTGGTGTSGGMGTGGGIGTSGGFGTGTTGGTGTNGGMGTGGGTGTSGGFGTGTTGGTGTSGGMGTGGGTGTSGGFGTGTTGGTGTSGGMGTGGGTGTSGGFGTGTSGGFGAGTGGGTGTSGGTGRGGDNTNINNRLYFD